MRRTGLRSRRCGGTCCNPEGPVSPRRPCARRRLRAETTHAGTERRGAAVSRNPGRRAPAPVPRVERASLAPALNSCVSPANLREVGSGARPVRGAIQANTMKRLLLLSSVVLGAAALAQSGYPAGYRDEAFANVTDD